jgi:2-dehydro-3-deoxy-D-arabinonate dehydratase
MSELLRVLAGDRPVVAVRTGPGAPLRRVATASLADLLALPLRALRTRVEAGLAGGEPVPRGRRPLPPVDGRTEVWACGVSYRRSRDARAQESTAADVYQRVYRADRPELFVKAMPWKVVGDGDPIGIRADSRIDVPEPELALVLTADGELAGLTGCDDVSSRSIEGDNPLYLPQAKIYAGACALGPVIRPAWELDPIGRSITLTVRRGGTAVFSGSTSTDQLHRDLGDLVEHLFRADHFPAGAILSTGTGIVPDLSFSLADGDRVSITIDGIGTLTNPVRRGKTALRPG